jgi:predicted glycosyltransferase
VGEITFMLSDNLICPKSIPLMNLIRLGASEDRIYQFNGYKEDVYIADYSPDPTFYSKIPFKEYIVVRPEASFAIYLREVKTIVPQLLKKLLKENFNVIYLPRNQIEKSYANNMPVYIPTQPLFGLDLCWYSEAVLTGSGSLAREAACLGVPAVSFYPGKLLSVDKTLINEGKIFYSRDPNEIVNYLLSRKRKDKVLNTYKSKKVKNEIITILHEIFNKYYKLKEKRL